LTHWIALARRASAVLASAAALAFSGAEAATPPPAAAAVQDTGREILVMLRIPPDHYRPNATYGGDYGDQFTIASRRRLAQRIAHRYGLEFVGDGWQMPLLGVDCYVMRVRSGETLEDAMRRISRDPEIAWSEPMHVYQAQQQSGARTEGDPLFAVQPAATEWRLADLHRVTTGRGVLVAVIDSRVEVDHPDLAGQVVSSQDFVIGRPGPAERHGTGVAGVIAAKAGNGIGIAGVAPDARLLALRACWQTDDVSPSAPTVCDSLSLAKALHYAIEHGAKVINLSLSGPSDRLLTQLIDIASKRDITVVAAYDASMPKGGFPASEPNVIAVANESLPSPAPGVYLAPGEDVPTTQPGGKWSLVNGSSYAAAQISGLVALVRERRDTTPRPLLVARLPTGGWVDACATLQRAEKSCDCSCPKPTKLAQAGR
jgi:hypothetical protein